MPKSRCQSSCDNITEMLCNFQHKPWLSVSNLQRIQNWWQVIVKLYVDDGTDDGYDATLRCHFLSSRLSCIVPT